MFCVVEDYVFRIGSNVSSTIVLPTECPRNLYITGLTELTKGNLIHREVGEGINFSHYGVVHFLNTHAGGSSYFVAIRSQFVAVGVGAGYIIHSHHRLDGSLKQQFYFAERLNILAVSRHCYFGMNLHRSYGQVLLVTFFIHSTVVFQIHGCHACRYRNLCVPVVRINCPFVEGINSLR